MSLTENAESNLDYRFNLVGSKDFPNGDLFIYEKYILENDDLFLINVMRKHHKEDALTGEFKIQSSEVVSYLLPEEPEWLWDTISKHLDNVSMKNFSDFRDGKVKQWINNFYSIVVSPSNEFFSLLMGDDTLTTDEKFYALNSYSGNSDSIIDGGKLLTDKISRDYASYEKNFNLVFSDDEKLYRLNGYDVNPMTRRPKICFNDQPDLTLKSHYDPLLFHNSAFQKKVLPIEILYYLFDTNYFNFSSSTDVLVAEQMFYYIAEKTRENFKKGFKNGSRILNNGAKNMEGLPESNSVKFSDIDVEKGGEYLKNFHTFEGDKLFTSHVNPNLLNNITSLTRIHQKNSNFIDLFIEDIQDINSTPILSSVNNTILLDYSTENYLSDYIHLVKEYTGEINGYDADKLKESISFFNHSREANMQWTNQRAQKKLLRKFMFSPHYYKALVENEKNVSYFPMFYEHSDSFQDYQNFHDSFTQVTITKFFNVDYLFYRFYDGSNYKQLEKLMHKFDSSSFAYNDCLIDVEKREELFSDYLGDGSMPLEWLLQIYSNY